MKVLILCLLVVAALAAHPKMKMVEQINNSNSTWTAKIQKGFGRDYTRLGELCGSLSGGPSLPALNELPVADSLPKNFDARTAEQFAMCRDVISEVRDQASCGSCWAFSAVTPLTDRFCIASGGKIKTRLSSEDLLSCCPNGWFGECGNGCRGGYASAAWNWFKSTGVVTGGGYGVSGYCNEYFSPMCDHHVKGTHGACQPIQPTPSCVKRCDSGYGKTYGADKHFVKSAYSIGGTAEEYKNEVYKNGPFQVTMTVYEDFEHYTSGVYKHVTGAYKGGHAVSLYGYGVENGEEYWLIKNSWNTEWGQGGFFKIAINECDILSGGYAGEPKL